jgi:hypothetical protein
MYEGVKEVREEHKNLYSCPALVEQVIALPDMAGFAFLSPLPALSPSTFGIALV